jgi:benzoyl-CoA reductase/2-hydroxyglutaryl-CoA dehydratase subunit BcrC/BadD/HgdB
MIQEEKKRPINRLKSMYALRAYVDKMYQKGQEAKEAGRPVAWCMLQEWASPILTAMGVQSVYPENYGTICAAGGVASSFLKRCEAEGFPSHLCGYARNCIGYTARMMDLEGQIPPEAPGEGMSKPLLLVSSGMICDARFKWFQALGRYLDVPIWTIESPSGGPRESLMEGAYEHEVSFLVKEIKEFVAFLERLLGKKMDWERLEELRGGTKEMDQVWYGVNELRQARPGPMHSRDFWSSMSAALYGGAAEYEELTGSYRNMYDEVKNRVNNKIGGINREERYRLIFEGLPPWHSLGFFDRLAERGWNFVTESYYHPRKPIEADLSKVSDPLERYVRSRYHGLARTLEENFGLEEAARVKEEIKRTGFSHHLTIKSVRDYQCDGAILHTLLTCRGTSAHLNLVGSQYMEVWKVPSLVIEGDIVDLTLFDPADALRKAEAFEETMDHYKKARREAGLEW